MLRPFRFSFISESLNGGKRVFWVRFYRDMEFALQDSKRVALRENSDAHGFMIESDQGDESIRRSWGLPN
jgi:hypothetical protein